MVTDNYQKHVSYNPIRKLLIKRFNRKLLSIVKVLDVESVLDVGCGEGFTLKYLQDAGIGKRIEGIDYDKNAISLGKKRHPEIKIVQGDIYKLPYRDNEFDLVICTEVLEHLDDPQKALGELTRVTKKYCILSVPNEPLFLILGYLRGQKPESIGHINHWTPENFKFYVSRHMKISAIYFPFPWTLVIAEK